MDENLQDEREQRADKIEQAKRDQHHEPTGPCDCDCPTCRAYTEAQEQRADELTQALTCIIASGVNTVDGQAAQLAKQGFGIACRECADLQRALTELMRVTGKIKVGQISGYQKSLTLLAELIDARLHAKKLLDPTHPKDGLDG